MTSWQKRTRTGLVVFGVAVGAVVYWSSDERRTAAPPGEVERLDPRAMLETTGAGMRQDRGAEQEFRVSFEQSLTYEDGSAHYLKVEIVVPKPDGREFVVTAREGSAGPGEVELRLTGDVVLMASDGFRLETDQAMFNQQSAVARAPGAITFSKGRMRGSGVEATYNERDDVLYLAQEAVVTLVDETGATVLDATADAGSLDRVAHVLILDGSVRVLRNSQVMRTDRAVARLSPTEEVVTHTQLRGHSRVEGGSGSVASMEADEIDLDYGDDGVTLDRVTLARHATVRLSDDGGRPGSSMSAQSLDVWLSPDGAVTSLTGRDDVDARVRTGSSGETSRVQADVVDATGGPDGDLAEIRFQRDVEYVEVASTSSSRRIVASDLVLRLDDDVVTDARFTGNVAFEEAGLVATAPSARYQPAEGRLRLGEAAGRGLARVSAEQLQVDARTIAVTLDGHGMEAEGAVQTSMAGLTADPTEGSEAPRAGPELLSAEEPVNVTGDAFSYDSQTGQAVYTGATLWQGESSVRGDRITIDRRRGDLRASGSARSTLVLDGARSEGRADEIAYEQDTRVLAYSVRPLTPTSGRGSAVERPHSSAQLKGPQGDLRAQRIEVILAEADNHVDRLEAGGGVDLTLGSRAASGSQLTYHAEGQRYVIAGTADAPARVSEGCRETRGGSLTFFASTDRLIVDGDERTRTETRPCGSAAH